ncbi:hypothetical protein niasHT_015740 [Heterodera trifolii]|uniref:Uncharacterized protein n=1 Tax=Heterodera trifolii TaxID=157864 RepID=A0ABD2L4I0_9BILA
MGWSSISSSHIQPNHIRGPCGIICVGSGEGKGRGGTTDRHLHRGHSQIPLGARGREGTAHRVPRVERPHFLFAHKPFCRAVPTSLRSPNLGSVGHAATAKGRLSFQIDEFDNGEGHPLTLIRLPVSSIPFRSSRGIIAPASRQEDG